jgi:hypothetical protein
VRFSRRAAKFGALTANELRQFAGLPEDNAFDGLLIGGRTTGITNALEAAAAEAVNHELSGRMAEDIFRRAISGRIGENPPSLSGRP